MGDTITDRLTEQEKDLNQLTKKEKRVLTKKTIAKYANQVIHFLLGWVTFRF